MATKSNPARGVIPRKTYTFELRENYLLMFEIGAVVALGTLVLLFRLPLTFDDAFEIPLDEHQIVVQMEEIEQTQQQVKPPPPPRPPVPVEVPNDVTLDDDILEIDSEIDFELAADVPPPPPPPVPEVKEEEEAEPEIFIVVEQMPELIGGLESIQRRIKYPEIAQKANIQGMVIVQFVVDETGKILNPKVVKSLKGGCDEEALRVIRLAKFKPGKQRGKAVRVKYSIPIRFQLRDKTS